MTCSTKARRRSNPIRKRRRAAPTRGLVFALALPLVGLGQESELARVLAEHPAQAILGTLELPSEGPLRFLAAGHIYGTPGMKRQIPASTFVSRIDDLAALEPNFIALLGDFVGGYSWMPETLPVLERLGAPVFNSPGNHDVTRRAEYEERFGRTWGGFRAGTSLFVFLDTELDAWRISPAQVDFLRRALAAAANEDIERAFVFAHRMIFAAGDERYDIAFQHSNSRSKWPGGSNFQSDVRPLLVEFARTRELTWFSGDVGVRWSMGLFHDFDERTGIRYVASGVGEQAWDNVLLVDVSADGRTVIEVIPLVDPRLPGLHCWGLDEWKEHFATRRAVRLTREARGVRTRPSDE